LRGRDRAAAGADRRPPGQLVDAGHRAGPAYRIRPRGADRKTGAQGRDHPPRGRAGPWLRHGGGVRPPRAPAGDGEAGRLELALEADLLVAAVAVGLVGRGPAAAQGELLPLRGQGIALRVLQLALPVHDERTVFHQLHRYRHALVSFGWATDVAAVA